MTRTLITAGGSRAAVLRVLIRSRDALCALSEYTGRAVAWLVLLLAFVAAWDVGMRYVFHSGSIRLQELQWHLFSLIFLLGAAYTLRHDGHVRLDLLYRSRYVNARRRAILDLVGTVLFLLPFCALVLSASLEFVHQAMAHNEGSPDPGGLPHRWLIKAAIPVGFGLLLLQGLADLADRIVRLMEPPA